MKHVGLALLLAMTACSQEFLDRAAMYERQDAAARAAYARSPEGQAELLCRHQADIAVAGLTRRGLFDMDGELRAMELRDRCMKIFRLTGRVP